MSYVDELRIRLKNVIVGTCNKIGCDNCDLKWDDGCSASDLQDKIWDEEQKEDDK